MAEILRLSDLLNPYVLGADVFGQWRDTLFALEVTDLDVAAGPTGSVVRGTAHMPPDARLTFDVQRRALKIETGSGAATGSGGDQILDFSGASFPFSLTGPREASDLIAAALGAGGSGLATVTAGFNALDDDFTDAGPSDFASTRFILDLMIEGAVLHAPFLKGALVNELGVLQPNVKKPKVKFTLPALKIRVSQGGSDGDPITANLTSAGSTGIDEIGSASAGKLIAMDPEYAYIGDQDAVGFAFRSAYLDLADGFTPPEVLAQFGYDESWTGLYFPEIRLFVAPNGMDDFAVAAGASNLLIGFGERDGVTGDFDLQVVDQGSGEVVLGARFYDENNVPYGIVRTGEGQAKAVLPETTRLVLDARGGRAPYTFQTTIGSAASVSGPLVDVTTPPSGTQTIDVLVRDGSPSARTATLKIVVGRRPAAITTSSTSPNDVTISTEAVDGRRIVIARQTSDGAVLALDPPAPAGSTPQWRIDGGAPTSGETLSVPVSVDASVSVTASIAAVAAVTGPLKIYFRFDRPSRHDWHTPGDRRGYATNPAYSHSTRAASTANRPVARDWNTGGGPALDAVRPVLTQLPSGTTITVTGAASYEGAAGSDAAYNYALSRRRAEAAVLLMESDPAIAAKGFTFAIQPDPVLRGLPGGNPPSSWVSAWQGRGGPVSSRSQWWVAEVSFPGTVGRPAIDLSADLTRGSTTVTTVTPPPDRTPPEPVSQPSWFRSAKLVVRIHRNDFVAVELTGEIDFQTAAEDRIGSGQGSIPMNTVSAPSGGAAAGPNTGDGITDYRLFFTIDQATGEWAAALALSADEADRDGLVWTGNAPGSETDVSERSIPRNMLGMSALFAPVLSAVAPPNPLDGDTEDIVLNAAVNALPATLAALPWFNVQRVILHGGELTVRERAQGPEVSVLLDVETAFTADVKLGDTSIIRVPTDKPVSVRYKAIGLRLGYTPPEEQFQFRPIFDSSKGYTIDMSRPGTIEVVEPLGSILTVLGARIARNNPLILDVSLGAAIDLGVVSLEKLGVRLPLDPAGPPQLTELGAGVNVPGAVEGKGYLKFSETEIKGQIDLAITPIKMRAAAGLGIANIPESEGGPATGVIVTLELQLPPPGIVLGASGVSIFGFIGLFAMHYHRDETPYESVPTPALSWLKATGGDPTKIDFWKPKVDNWAFGLGALLGTAEGGYVLSLKGMILLELPGPRLLLMMKAKLLSPPPEGAKGQAEGNLLAVIDLDFGRDRMTIGIAAEYTIKPLLEIKIPVEAYFNLRDGSDWHVYLGSRPGPGYPGPIHAKILEAFEGMGYLMLSGDGLPAGTGGVSGRTIEPVSGFAIGAGLHVTFIWGNTSIGLYLKIQGGFDAVLGFDPLFVQGIMYIRGELRLFIISIAAWAELDAKIGQRLLPDGATEEIARLDGEVCGKVKFFFFEVKGCVKFSLGDETAPLPAAPDLMRGVTLQSRTPALVFGTGSDQPVDGAIGDARLGEETTPPDDLPVVPIDAIPVLAMAATPMDNAAAVLGDQPNGFPGAPAPDGFVTIGDERYKYDLNTVTLESPAEAGPALTTGATPSVWWRAAPPAEAGTADARAAQLALLSWTPEPTPNAIERSFFLDERVRERWGRVCRQTAPAAAVMWTFREERLGPSDVGWVLRGEPWPDPPGAARSLTPDLSLKIDERWRSGDRALDVQRGITPAVVEGLNVPCGLRDSTRAPAQEPPSREPNPASAAPEATRETPAPAEPALAARAVDAVALDASARARLAEGVNADMVLEAAPLELDATSAKVIRGRMDALLDAVRGQKILDDAPAVRVDVVEAARRLAAGADLKRAELFASPVQAQSFQSDRFAALASQLAPGARDAMVTANASVVLSDAAEPLAARKAALTSARRSKTQTAPTAPTLTVADRARLDDQVKLATTITDRVAERLRVADDDKPANAAPPASDGPPAANAPPRDDGAATTKPDKPAASQPQGQCRIRALAAPFLDEGDAITPHGHGDRAQVEARLNALGVERGPLHEVVTLHLGPVDSARVLTLARRRLVEAGRYVFRARDEDGREIWRQTATTADILPPMGVPPRWIDASGPWIDDFVLAIYFWYYLMMLNTDEDYVFVLLQAPRVEGAATFEIGVAEGPEDTDEWFVVSDRKIRRLLRAYYVNVIEAVRLGEIEREEWDERDVERDREALEDALGAGSDDYALMRPGRAYRVSVDYTVERGAGGAPEPNTAHYWFRTAEDSPKRLDPWMLCTTPGPDEAHVFLDDAVRLVFATNTVVQFYEAYGERLEVRFSPSSLRTPESTPATPHPLPIDAGRLQPIEASVLSPWEDTVLNVLNEPSPLSPGLRRGACVNVDEARHRHARVDVPYALERFTDYVLDVETVKLADEADRERVFRLQFSTGGFESMEAFAATFREVRTIHRYAEPGAMAGVAATFAGRQPEGAELDNALIAAGLEPLKTPNASDVMVFWEQSGSAPPQPAAILVDAPEPMFRNRLLPGLEPVGEDGHARWMMTPQQWLRLEGVEAADDAHIQAIVRQPGDARALVVLKANRRGERVRLQLRKSAFPAAYLDGAGASDTARTVVDLTFDRAPWEDAP